MLLKNEIELAQKKIKPAENFQKVQIEKEIKEVDRQVTELISMLTQIKNRNPLLAKIDSLEDEKIILNKNLSEFKDDDELELTAVNSHDMDLFFEQYRNEIKDSDVEKKKAIIRSLVDDMTFDGFNLNINPNYQSLTGFKLASPRGFEPLLLP